MKMNDKIIIFFGVAVICILNSFSVQGGEETKKVDTERFLMALKTSLENHHSDFCARGKSKVFETTINNNGEYDNQEYSVSFMFKGNNSRSDIYELNNENEFSLDRIWFMNSEKSGLYSNKTVLLQSDSFDYFQRNYGRDYHPDTFQIVCGIPFAEWIDLVEERLKDIDIQIGENETAKIKLEFKERGVFYHHEIVLNTNEFHVEEWLCDVKGEKDEISWIAKYKWDTFGPHLYVKELNYEEKETRAGVDKLLNKRRVVIENMSVVDDIDDKLFTAGGLSLPETTVVTDKVLGIVYRLGSPAIVERDLLTSLEESHKYSEVQSAMVNFDVKETKLKSEPSAANPIKSQEVGEKKSHNRKYIYICGLALIIVLGIVFIVSKCRLGR